jgi:hypothetical protein
MAGALTISTLNNDTGVLATQNGMTGICKAWCIVNGTSGSGVVTNSYNVSSVTRNLTGVYTVNFTTAMPNANYAISGSFEADSGNNTMQLYATPGGGGTAPTLKTTTQCQIMYSSGGTRTDPFTGSFMAMGN